MRIGAARCMFPSQQPCKARAAEFVESLMVCTRHGAVVRQLREFEPTPPAPMRNRTPHLDPRDPRAHTTEIPERIEPSVRDLVEAVLREWRDAGQVEMPLHNALAALDERWPQLPADHP